MTFMTATETLDSRQTPSRRRRWVSVLLLELALWAALAAAGWSIATWRSPILAAGVVLAGFVIVDGAVRGWGRWWEKTMGALLLLVAAAPLTLGLTQLYAWYGPRPEPTHRTLFHGVEYIREVLDEPYATVVHLIIVDLKADGVGVLVTPPDFPGHEHHLKARTTSQFVRESGVKVAINANHYGPFRTNLPFDVYPLPGDPVEASGGAATAGQHYGVQQKYWVTLDIDSENRARIARDLPQPWHNAITGIKHFIIGGKPIWAGPNEAPVVTAAAAIDESGTKLYLVVADGEQPPNAIGIQRSLLSDLLVRHGASDAVALDAGGSATMVIQGPHGGPMLVNRPVQAGIPMVERPVANHLGIHARPLP